MNPRRAILTFALLASLVLNAAAGTRYVDLNSPSPTPPYTNWLTAATNIQDAVDTAVAGDTVLVTNGVYAMGGLAVSGVMTNRVVVNKPVTLSSVNGPSVTIIQGYQVPLTTNGDGAVRCIYLTNGAGLSGFTLTNGATRATGSANDISGGGLWCESTNVVISNCVVTANSANASGAGAYRGTLIDCFIRGNFVKLIGGSSPTLGGGLTRAF